VCVFEVLVCARECTDTPIFFRLARRFDCHTLFTWDGGRVSSWGRCAGVSSVGCDVSAARIPPAIYEGMSSPGHIRERCGILQAAFALHADRAALPFAALSRQYLICPKLFSSGDKNAGAPTCWSSLTKFSRLTCDIGRTSFTSSRPSKWRSATVRI